MFGPSVCAMAAAMAAVYPVIGVAADTPSTTTATAQALPVATEPATNSASDVNGATAKPAPAAVAQAGQNATLAATQPQTLETIEVVAKTKKLDAARNGLSPDTGSTIYKFDQQDIVNLPQGDSTPLNQVILQAPGAAQDSFGQLHVRGDHANLQYRINGVVIPEAISGFGQALDTRFADQLNILTGALPAQYGYRTAGVIDIHSKGTAFDNGGRVSLTAGSHDHQELGAEVGGTKGAFTYYLTGSYLRNDLGIENPTPDRNAVHDTTKQGKGFGYLSYLLGDDSRVSFIFGTSSNKFQIPNRPGQTPSFTLDGAPGIASENLDARQDEKNTFQVLSYQGAVGTKVDYQVALFHRYTDVHYQPDPLGDLVFNGIAAQILRKNEVTGLQSDASYRLSEAHTVRSGIFLQRERFGVDNSSQVFPADDQGNQLSSTSLTIQDNSHITGHLYGVYLQDEWKPTNKLTVNYGARYDKVSTVVDESQVSPRVGLVYDLTDQTRLHAGYARYFTPPPTELIDTTTVQKFLGTTNALPSDANTAVKSERSNYFDVGLAHQLTPQVTLGIDGYYRQVDHLQDEGQFGNALIFSAFNYAKGKIYGIELSGSYKGTSFTAYANASYSLARGKTVETGQFHFGQDQLDFIASHWVHLDHDQRMSGSAGAAYRWQDTTFSADALYGSGLRRGFANTEHLPGYTQVNAAVAQHFDLGSFGKLDGRISVINLFDKSYEIRDGTGIGVGAPQFGPRRAYYVSVSKPF
jgi:outer membrane receptor protein involved in Fe transport